MVYLALMVATIVSFQHLLRLGQAKSGNVLAAGAVNYMVASLFAIARFIVEKPAFEAGAWRVAVPLGCINGFLFVAHLFVVLASYQAAGVGITVAVTNSSAVVPVLVAWYVWSGPMTFFRWLAIALLPAAMILMRPARQAADHLNLRSDTVLFLSFLMAGTIGTIHKAQNVYADVAAQPIYHLSLFVTASLCSLIYVLWNRLPFRAPDVAIGVPLGLANSLTLLFLLWGLQQIPATVFFPTSSMATILANLFLARLFWGETITRRQIGGVLLALVIVCLANVTW